MRSKPLVRIVARSVAGLVLVTALGATAQNLLRNNSFETPSATTSNAAIAPEGWNVFGHERDGTQVGITSAAAHTGAQSVRLSSTGVPDSYQGLCQSIAVAAGKEYQFAVYVHNDLAKPLKGTNRGQISMEWKDATGAEVDRTWGPDWGALSGDNWMQFKMTGRAPAKATQCFAVITLHEGKAPGGGAFLADDPSVTDMPAGK